jgi:hypothetical protein
MRPAKGQLAGAGLALTGDPLEAIVAVDLYVIPR